MSVQCWIDGMPADSVPVMDRGLQYGDGLFETFAVHGGRICLLNHHLDRLLDGCAKLEMPAPERSALCSELSVAAAGQSRAVLKLVLTRGSGGRGYRPPEGARSRRILMRHPWPDYPPAWAEQGVQVRVCCTRLAHQPRLAGIKHLNRLEQVLGRAEWRNTDDVQEGLMLDLGGAVIEGTMTNVFASPREGVLVTPDLVGCGVAGVMRRHILESARAAGVDVQIKVMSLVELQECAEVFLTNSVIRIWPVNQLEGRRHELGPMTRAARSWTNAA